MNSFRLYSQLYTKQAMYIALSTTTLHEASLHLVLPDLQRIVK
jgi:hypothetical protein